MLKINGKETPRNRNSPPIFSLCPCHSTYIKYFQNPVRGYQCIVHLTAPPVLVPAKRISSEEVTCEAYEVSRFMKGGSWNWIYFNNCNGTDWDEVISHKLYELTMNF